MVDERLFTVQEVADLMRVDPVTVRRWLKRGQLRGFRPGGTKAGWRITEGEVRRLQERQGNGDGDGD